MTTDIESILPGPTARGDGLEFAKAIWSSMLDLEQDALNLQEALGNLDIAASPALDLLGDWVSEKRLGLEDAPYRLIIAGRRVAQAGGVTPPAVIRGWRAVTGDDEATMNEEPSEVHLVANVEFLVDTAWLARAAEVTRATIGNGRALHAVVAQPGAFVWDESTFENAAFANDFGG